MLMLDLDQVNSTFRRSFLWSFDRPNIVCFRQKDYFRKSRHLKKDLIDFLTTKKIKGVNKIFILTTPRVFGVCYNPVSFYYCYQGSTLRAIISDINNTPWNERFAYVHHCNQEDITHTFNFDKEFHISPFMPMHIKYNWQFTKPNDVIVISMNNNLNSEKVFNATLKLKRRSISGLSLTSYIFKYPLSPLETVFKIYWNALKLWFKKTPFYSHPLK